MRHRYLQQSVGMVFVHVFGDQIFVQTLNYFIDCIRDNKAITTHAKDQIIRFMMTVKSLLPLFQSLNRVLFYWNGTFYTWAKRFFNISYVSNYSYNTYTLSSKMLYYYYFFLRFMVFHGIILSDHYMCSKFLAF